MMKCNSIPAKTSTVLYLGNRI